MNMRVQPPLPAKIWLLKYVVHTYGEHRVPSTKQRKRKRGKAERRYKISSDAVEKE